MDAVSKQNVLYLSYDGLTDPLGQSQVLPYLAGLSKEGYVFTVISFEKKEKLEKEGPLIRQLTEAAGINWVPLSFTSQPPILSKIYDRQRMWRTALSLHKKFRFQMTHCRSYVSAEVGLKLKRKYRVKMLFDMRGFWADEKVDAGQWNLENPVYKKIYTHYKKREKEFLLEADGIVSLTAAAKDYLLQRPEYENLSIEVIPCCADLDHFDFKKITDKDKAAARASLQIPNAAKVISYVGSFGGWYMTNEMFRFFKLLLEKHPEYVLLFLTKDNPEKVKEAALQAGIDLSKLFVKYVTRPMLPAYISLSNCSIFFIRNTFSKLASSPTKHAELMGMGVPVICNDIGDTGKIILKTSTGHLVNAFTDDSLQDVVSKLPSTVKIEKTHIRNCAIELFDLQSGVAKYLSLYNSIIPSHSIISADISHA